MGIPKSPSCVGPGCTHSVGVSRDPVIDTLRLEAALTGHWALAVSLGVGLLMGIERERNKGEGAERRPAGVRTFALVGVMGGLCATFDEVVVLGVGAAFVGLSAIAAYLRSARSDPGLTTEIALVIAFLLGALAIDEAALAAAVGVVVTILLASRTQLHQFTSRVLSERELHDGLTFAAAALVVLPLVPNHAVGPYGVFNPFTVWRLVVIVMGVSVAGYIARRTLGPRFGLPVAGLAGGFVSALATIWAMAGRAKREPDLTMPALAGALLANVATIVLMAGLVGATSPATLNELAIPLAGAGLAAALAGSIATMRAWSGRAHRHDEAGRAFDLRTSVLFAATLTGVLWLAAWLNDVMGTGGLIVGSAAAGLADTHAAAISVAALVAAGKVDAHQGAIAILAALSANSATKLIAARAAGAPRFWLGLMPGLAAMVALAWAGTLVGG
jgi:uncharacterized membrane protein (DUF4010 family)